MLQDESVKTLGVPEFREVLPLLGENVSEDEAYYSGLVSGLA